MVGTRRTAQRVPGAIEALLEPVLFEKPSPDHDGPSRPSASTSAKWVPSCPTSSPSKKRKREVLPQPLLDAGAFEAGVQRTAVAASPLAWKITSAATSSAWSALSFGGRRSSKSHLASYPQTSDATGHFCFHRDTSAFTVVVLSQAQASSCKAALLESIVARWRLVRLMALDWRRLGSSRSWHASEIARDDGQGGLGKRRAPSCVGWTPGSLEASRMLRGASSSSFPLLFLESFHAGRARIFSSSGSSSFPPHLVLVSKSHITRDSSLAAACSGGVAPPNKNNTKLALQDRHPARR